MLADQTRHVENSEVITTFLVSELLGGVVEGCVTTDGSLRIKWSLYRGGLWTIARADCRDSHGSSSRVEMRGNRSHMIAKATAAAFWGNQRTIGVEWMVWLGVG